MRAAPATGAVNPGGACSGLEVQDALYASGNPTRRRLHRRRRNWILGRIAAWTPRTAGGAALEVGPGGGGCLPDLCRRFTRVVASDVAEPFLQRARSLAGRFANLAVAADDIAATRHASASFDLVLCSEVLEHLPRPQPALAGLARVLAPGGVLILTTPQAWSTVELGGRLLHLPGVPWLLRRLYREPVEDLRHVSLCTAGRLRRRFAAAGLAVVESARFGLYLPLLAECGGRWGSRRAASLEDAVARAAPGLLWTQAYVLRRAVPSGNGQDHPRRKALRTP